MVKSSIRIAMTSNIELFRDKMLNMPQLFSLAIKAVPTAAMGKIKRTRRVFIKVMEIFIVHLFLFDVVNVRLGAAVSHTANNIKIAKKKLSLIKISLSIMNIFIGNNSLIIK